MTRKIISRFGGQSLDKQDFAKDDVAEKMLRELRAHCLREVERRARILMKTHPELKDYCQGMGTAFFKALFQDEDSSAIHYLETEDVIDHPELELDYLFDYILEWNKYVGLTGCPMRFTATSKVVTDW